MYNIMVVEDDYNTRKLMCAVLERNGYLPVPANDGMDALRQLENTHIDLLLLDIMMPNMDGYELTQTLRSKGNMIPILMVTAKQTPADKHRGFLLGTDDYMTKPVDEEEMILRIAALLRRSRVVSERKLVVGKTVLFYDALTVRTDGETTTPAGGMELPQKEFMLLFKLLSYPNQIFTRRQLKDEIWDTTSESDERTIDVHISRVRDRFRDNHDFEIVTVRGLGYKGVYLK